MRRLVEESDIDDLHGADEDETLEVKREPIRTDKLVEIIQSFANGVADGGHIVIGLRQDADGRIDTANKEPVTYPVQPPGAGVFNTFDAYRLHLLQTVQSSTSGYHEGLVEIREVRCAEGPLIVVGVPQSDLRPHYHVQNMRAYMRGQGRTYPMTPDDLARQVNDRNRRTGGQATPEALRSGAHTLLAPVLELATTSPEDAVMLACNIVEAEIRLAAIRSGFGPADLWHVNLQFLRTECLSEDEFWQIRKAYEVTPSKFKTEEEARARIPIVERVVAILKGIG